MFCIIPLKYITQNQNVFFARMMSPVWKYFIGCMFISALMTVNFLYFSLNSKMWFNSGKKCGDNNSSSTRSLSYNCDDYSSSSKVRTVVIFPFREREMHLKMILSPVHIQMMRQVCKSQMNS